MKNTNVSRRQLFRATIQAAGAGVMVAMTARQGLAETVARACGLTPRQTEGPFYPVKDQADKDHDLTQVKGRLNSAKGQLLGIVGKVIDSSCRPVQGALVEIWQACASGRYNHPGDTSGNELDPDFQYWGRAETDEAGNYSFKTILPGHYRADVDWIRPPHIHYKISALGFHEMTTQLYFEGNPYNERDHVLKGVPPAERSKVVVPLVDGRGLGFEAGSKACRFDIGIRSVRG